MSGSRVVGNGYFLETDGSYVARGGNLKPPCTGSTWVSLAELYRPNKVGHFDGVWRKKGRVDERAHVTLRHVQLRL